MIETIVNLIIWLVKTVFSDSFWTLMSIIAIIIAITNIVTVVINWGDDFNEKVKNATQIGSSILILVIAAIILSITLR